MGFIVVFLYNVEVKNNDIGGVNVGIYYCGLLFGF